MYGQIYIPNWYFLEMSNRWQVIAGIDFRSEDFDKICRENESKKKVDNWNQEKIQWEKIATDA